MRCWSGWLRQAMWRCAPSMRATAAAQGLFNHATRRAYFYELLRRQLAELAPLLVAGDIGLMFLDALPLEEAISLLRERQRKVAERIASYEQAPAHDLGMGVDLALEHALGADARGPRLVGVGAGPAGEHGAGGERRIKRERALFALVHGHAFVCRV